MLLIDQHSKKVPFTLLFAEKIDPDLYAEAIKDSQKLSDTYDPATQTSDFSIYAGTTLTYDDTRSSTFLSIDDTRQSDT